LKTALAELPPTAFHVQHSPFQAALAEGLAAAGRVAEAMAVIEEALTGSEAKEEHWCRAELLRVKGEILLRGTTEQSEAAEQAFASSLSLARMQGALSWELRTATSLAKMHRALGRPKDALDLLAPVLGKFEEGFRTVDVVAAAALKMALAGQKSTRSSLS
jgi:predicted ATPase